MRTKKSETTSTCRAVTIKFLRRGKRASRVIRNFNDNWGGDINSGILQGFANFYFLLLGKEMGSHYFAAVRYNYQDYEKLRNSRRQNELAEA